MEDKNFDTLCRNLSKQVKAARQQADLSQEALALAAEVDRSYVSQLERGLANPSLQILHRLAQALGHDLRITFVPPAKNPSADNKDSKTQQ
ncbi:helix-turn-helix domain-containing protein [Diaphorobacter nitroreducens]|uniref:helix-turn-helix domain-containing protein n=1 Tax=Diaphorobacter nitroreducens TaxID=164759 RepID=UPI000B59C55C|nr:helix-turn-helix transcriptional regulator [Diaphorobacter nitroreducens]